MPRDFVLSACEPVPGVELLLATDFDGTVSPIVRDPGAARLDPIMRAILGRAGGDPRVCIAFISGRDADDVQRRTEGVTAFIAGSHGLVCLDPRGRSLWTPRKQFPEPDPSLLHAVARCGLHVERKSFSIAVHFRETTLRDHHALGSFISWAHAEGLEVVPGRKVVEARLRGGGKRAALRAIARYVREKRVVFAGDDSTDFPALAFAAPRGRAIFVESSERSAPDIEALDRVTGVEALGRIFEQEIDRATAQPSALAPGPRQEPNWSLA